MTLWSHRPNFRNSFKSVLSATVEAEGSGSVIAGQLGMHFATRLFLMFWMGLVALFGIGALGVILAAGMPVFVAFPMAAVPLAMLAFGCLLLFVGRRTARGDEAKILAFLRDAVDARPVGDAEVSRAGSGWRRSSAAWRCGWWWCCA